MAKPARPKGRIIPEGKDPRPKPPKRPGLKRIVDGQTPKKKYPVVQVQWDESERGWGVRPDGYSFHLNEEDAKAFIKEYWSKMPDSVPDEYSRPENESVVDVGPKLYRKIKNSKNGIRTFEHAPNLEG